MQKQILIFSLLLFLANFLTAQTNESIPDKFLQGYTKSLVGQKISYHSPHPDVTSSLLVRSLDAAKFIEWETEVVPENLANEFVIFLWMFGIDINADSHQFDLFVNGARWFTFSNPKTTDQKMYRILGRDGSALIFRTMLVDKYDDVMGYAMMKLPRSALLAGKSQKIKIVGESAGSRAWYMTFESGIEEKITIQPLDLLFRENGKLLRSVKLNIVHLGNPVKGSFKLDSGLEKQFELELGFNAIQMKIPEVQAEKIFNTQIKIGDQPVIEESFALKPVRQWTIYLVQHTHTDIGYTRPQSEILPEHLRFIDYALDYCDQTDGYPDDARFRWTCENSWSVREYLKNRPAEQIRRFKQRAAEGRIEVTAMFFNMSEIIDETALVAQLQPIREYKKQGIPVVTAMQNDVNGIGWCLVDYFDAIGVKYVTMGENAARALLPFDKPTAFWWESPSGKRVLAFRPDHYMTANFMGLHTGKMEAFESALLDYLKNLSEKNYPFDQIAIQYSGYFTDNSPPSIFSCDLIKAWNERYEWPKLRNATAHEFMAHIEKNQAAQFPITQLPDYRIPTYRTAWPDWWTDGFGSAMRETAFARQTHADFIANQGLLSLAMMLGSDISVRTMADVSAIQDALLFYDEHTFGAAESISDPTLENSMVQWGEKSAYAWDAVKKNRLLREEIMGLMQSHISKSDVPTLVVFNTLNWQRSGLVEVYIDHQQLPLEKAFRIVDKNGDDASAQAMSSRADGTTWAIWVKNIPPSGYKFYRIEVRVEERALPTEKNFEGVLENKFYKLIIDQTKGVVTSLFDNELQQELVDPSSSWQLGQFIYEQLGNRQQLEQLKLEDFKRTTLTDIEIGKVTEGSIWQSLHITGQQPACCDEKGVDCEIRLFNQEKRLEFHFSLRKLPVVDPEGVYIAFPFQLPASKIVFEAQGGLVTPGENQLEGTSSDWNTIQNFAAIRSDQGQIVFGSQEIPLVHFGGINLGKFQYISKPEKPHIFSWVLNNYWTTNFKASQDGELNWSYFITSSQNSSNDFATRFGWGSRVPLLTRVLPSGKGNPQPLSRSLFNLDSDNILMVNSRLSADGKGIVFHLREVNGKMTELNFDALLKEVNFKTATEVNVLEEPIARIKSKMTIQPYEVKFIKLERKR